MQSLIIVLFHKWAGGAPGSTMCCSSSTFGIFGGGRSRSFVLFVEEAGGQPRYEM
jgi:hypothetical protein